MQAAYLVHDEDMCNHETQYMYKTPQNMYNAIIAHPAVGNYRSEPQLASPKMCCGELYPLTASSYLRSLSYKARY